MKQHALTFEKKQRRLNRTRTRLAQTSTLPRLSVHRTLRHIQAQIIEPMTGKILAHSHDINTQKINKTKSATIVGEDIAKKAEKANISSVVFDRGSYRYHGRIAALADAARKSGLKF